MSNCVDVVAEPIAVVLTAGETFKVAIELSDEHGNPVDPTGWTWDVDLLDTDLATVATITVTLLDGPAGILELGLADTITATLPPADYTWPVRATDTTPETKDLFTGQLRIKAVGT